MPEEKENFDNENSAVIDSFRRKKEAMEDQGEHAERSLKAYLKQALGATGSEKRKNVARDLIKISKGKPSEFRGGEYGSDLIKEPLPTGFEPKNWDEEDYE